MKTFSFLWSDALEEAIKQAASTLDQDYSISMRAGDDFEALKAAVNQGIDSHLQAVGLAEQEVETTQCGSRWNGSISPDSLHVLVRRLMEAGDEASDSLASSICATLDIELV